MREIKFRAWDDGKMLSMPINTVYGISRFFGILREDAIIMQFTGLQDKNGKDIYEGDIVNDQMKGFEKRKSIVQWDSVNTCFVLKRIDNKYNHTDYEYDFNKCDLMTIEAIGNIHENPELI